MNKLEGNPIKKKKGQAEWNWMLQVQDEVIGYWPSSIFSTLADGATALLWGGEIVDSNSDDHHTSTQMGSGHFPSESLGKSSYIRNLAWVDDTDNQRKAEDLQPLVTNRSCYGLHVLCSYLSDACFLLNVPHQCFMMLQP